MVVLLSISSHSCALKMVLLKTLLQTLNEEANLSVLNLLDVRNNQSLKGAVGTTLCQNEADLKISMEIDHQISSTDQDLVEIPIGNYTSASFWQSVTTTTDYCAHLID